MAVRSINFTGRKKILLEDIHLVMEDSKTSYQVSGTIDLKGYNLPEGQVVIELYRQNYRERREIGFAADIVKVAESFDPYSMASVLLCDIKVVSIQPGSDGKVLAWAHGVQPELGANSAGMRKGLLSFVESDDLGDVLWVTDLSEQDNPIVKVNAGIPEWKNFCRAPLFQALVMPEITRDIAQWLWEASERVDESLKIKHWMEAFKSFGADLETYRQDNPDDTEHQWSTHAAKEFAGKFEMLKRLPADHMGEF